MDHVAHDLDIGLGVGTGGELQRLGPLVADQLPQPRPGGAGAIRRPSAVGKTPTTRPRSATPSTAASIRWRSWPSSAGCRCRSTPWVGATRPPVRRLRPRTAPGCRRAPGRAHPGRSGWQSSTLRADAERQAVGCDGDVLAAMSVLSCIPLMYRRIVVPSYVAATWIQVPSIGIVVGRVHPVGVAGWHLVEAHEDLLGRGGSSVFVVARLNS